MYRVPGGYPQGPRSLHFRGKRPILRLPELASSCAPPQAAALRDNPCIGESETRRSALDASEHLKAVRRLRRFTPDAEGRGPYPIPPNFKRSVLGWLVGW